MGRPSDNRRSALKKSESKKTFCDNLSNLTPIQRYYQTAKNIKKKHDDAITTNSLDEAYVYGVRFANLSMHGLPTHGYYNVQDPELIRLRKENENNLKVVISQLEQIAESMDLDELEKREIRRRETLAMKKVREREEQMKKEEENRKATQELRDRLAQLDTVPVSTSASTSTRSIHRDTGSQQPQPTFAAMAARQKLPPPSYASACSNGTTNTGPVDAPENTNRDLPIGGDLPLPLPMPMPVPYSADTCPEETETNAVPPPPPPPYESLHPASAELHGDVQNKPPAPVLPLVEYRAQSSREYYNLKQKQQIQIFQLNTYQGKNPSRDSTNGCTVISPLVAVNHLKSPGSGIADMKIESIIDFEAPEILHKVRRKLGLVGHALIIPSDVHDYLHNQKILNDDMFVGVCGGNLLDPDHVSELINLLENGEDVNPASEEDSGQEEKKDMSRKVAAALFFHEHVISILKVVTADGTMWYDLVDSLPKRLSSNSIGATRTRCKDRESLQVLLSWYACEKFSPSDEKYINSNRWDDTMADFDPRVFQGFVWKN